MLASRSLNGYHKIGIQYWENFPFKLSEQRGTTMTAAITFLLGLLGYALSFLDKVKHRKWYNAVLGAACILFCVVFWLEQHQSQSEQQKAEQRTDQADSLNTLLSNNVDSLQELVNVSLLKLTAQESTLVEIGRKIYPGLPSSEAIQKLAGEIATEKAVVSVSDFYRVLNRMDTHFKETVIDSIRADFAGRGLFHSGIYLTGLRTAAISYRRVRDNFIDSSRVRMEQLGVNTDTLQFAKKLPVKVGTILSSDARAMGLDESDLNDLKTLDSL